MKISRRKLQSLYTYVSVCVCARKMDIRCQSAKVSHKTNQREQSKWKQKQEREEGIAGAEGQGQSQTMGKQTSHLRLQMREKLSKQVGEKNTHRHTRLISYKYIHGRAYINTQWVVFFFFFFGGGGSSHKQLRTVVYAAWRKINKQMNFAFLACAATDESN